MPAETGRIDSRIDALTSDVRAARDESKSLGRSLASLVDQLRHLGTLVEIIAKEQGRIATTYSELSQRFSEMMGVTVRARTGEAERYHHVEERLAELERVVGELRADPRR